MFSGALRVQCEPLKHRSEDLRIRSVDKTFAWIHDIVVLSLYCNPLLSWLVYQSTVIPLAFIMRRVEVRMDKNVWKCRIQLHPCTIVQTHWKECGKRLMRWPTRPGQLRLYQQNIVILTTTLSCSWGSFFLTALILKFVCSLLALIGSESLDILQQPKTYQSPPEVLV